MPEDQSARPDAPSEQNPRMSEFVLQALKKKENRKEEPNDDHPADQESNGDETRD